MFNIKLKYSNKFYLGIALFVLNFVLGAVVKVWFLFKFKDLRALKDIALLFNSPDSFYLWALVIVYLISWVMLILGLWWIGAEYTAALKKYFTYKFYHESLKKGTSTVIGKTAAGTKAMGRRTLEMGGRFRSRLSGRKNDQPPAQ